MYRQLKDEYFGFVRQAGELDLQLKEMEVVEKLSVAHFRGAILNISMSHGNGV